jgi:hypothetical protein
MISDLDYNIYTAIQQNKKITEIYLGFDEIEWFYSVAKYSATFTEAIDFTLFDKTICGLLQIEEHLSLEQIGEILGFNVIDNPSEKKYKDVAEYEILKEALQTLEDYEMIDGGDIDFSYCTLTTIGKEYVSKGKKFKIHQNKEFELYFDYTSQELDKAKENFEFIKGIKTTNNENYFDFEDEEFLKSFAQNQIPGIYNPDNLNSFKDAECIEINHFKSVLYRIYVLNITNGKISTHVIDPTSKSINEFFSEYDSKVINDNIIENFIVSNYQMQDFDIEENEVVISLYDFQERINQASDEKNAETVLSILKDYYINSLFIEPTLFLKDISNFIGYKTQEIWLLLKKVSKKEIDTLKALIDSYQEKFFFIYLETDEVSQRFYDQINKNAKKYKNVYILLMDAVAEFNVLFKTTDGIWNVFKNGKYNIPVLLNGNLNYIEKEFIYKNVTEIDLEENYLKNYRIEFAKEYTPIIHRNVSSYLNELNIEEETSIKKLNELRSIDNRIIPFQNIEELKSLFTPLKNKKQEGIQIILKNREQKIRLSIEKIELKLIERKQHSIVFLEKIENQISKEKEKCLQEELSLFIDLETKLKSIKKDVEIASKRKSIIIDTNILLEEANIIEMIGQYQTIVFSGKVIDELDNLKIKPELQEKAQKAIRNIHRHRQDQNIKFETSKIDNLPRDFNKKSPDNIILSVALLYLKRNPIILTNDKGMSIKAKTLDIPAKNIHELKAILEMSKPIKSKKRRI